MDVMSRISERDVTTFGLRLTREARQPSDNTDVAKLFFDIFSKRLTGVEHSTKSFDGELEKLKHARDRSQISDLVLLERLQKVEALLNDLLTWTKKALNSTSSKSESYSLVESSAEAARKVEEIPYSPPLQRIVVPGGEAGSLPSVATPTEHHVLVLLAERGPMSAPEIGKVVGRSREHSARLMRKLFDEGYLRRDQSRIPFRYSLMDRVRQNFKKAETKPEEKETVTVPQS